MTIADLRVFLDCLPLDTEVVYVDIEIPREGEYNHLRVEYNPASHPAWVQVWGEYGLEETIPLADFPAWYVASATKLVGNNG